MCVCCKLGERVLCIAMAKPEIPSEVPSRRRKRELSEDNIINESIESEGAVNNDSEESEDDIINDSKESEGDIINDSDDSDESDCFTDYDSDDPAFEILEGKADRKIWKQYHKERIESEGFDISIHPGTSFMAGIAQQNGHLVNPKIKEEYTELCKLAIHDFNSKNDKMYEFEEIVNVNASSAAGTWYYFTFKARDTTADAIKTFQALVWHGIDRTIDVSFCRLKKFLTEEDKKKMRKERKKTRREAFKKAEQDKPSLVKCFAPGLVIEELCKGKAGEKKAYPGYKVCFSFLIINCSVIVLFHGK